METATLPLCGSLCCLGWLVTLARKWQVFCRVIICAVMGDWFVWNWQVFHRVVICAVLGGTCYTCTEMVSLPQGGNLCCLGWLVTFAWKWQVCDRMIICSVSLADSLLALIRKYFFSIYCVLTKCVSPWYDSRGWLGIKTQSVPVVWCKVVTLVITACIYNGQAYRQDQLWYDGCNAVCRCEDASVGFYRCQERSVCVFH